MSKLAWRKPLKINKAERYSLDLNSSTAANPDRSVGINWLGGESITEFDITAPDGSNLSITEAANNGGVLSFIISGAMMDGYYEIDISYATADRNDCTVVRLTVIGDCDAQTNPEWSGILNGSTIIGC